MKERPILFNAETQEWRAVIGYEGKYEVSNNGQVRSLSSYHGRNPNALMNPFTNKKGYQYITLRDGFGGKKKPRCSSYGSGSFCGNMPARKASGALEW